MSGVSLDALLERNDAHADSLPEDHFDAVQDGQRPAVVSVCCSDSRVSQEGMWDATEPGWIFTPSNIGNQVRERHDGDLVVDGSVLYPIAHTETGTAAVVGHTGCGAITAAYRAVRGEAGEEPPGIEHRIELLVPIVEEALEKGVVAPDAEESTAINRLVEYNVRRQVEFLREAPEVPDEQRVYGFVYDFQRVYGSTPGRTYLVSADGETDPDRLRELVGEDAYDHVRSLLA
ncbi:carbonic anhydrase [Halalkalicoccus jeotgali]|uniref:carbonic anhydrase n=1 Tax=Halalkalicoccus jeotgali (strain DSM 18796 / CECT 7217 / JCM 14584 / KCTC 4019 / B3) TaxID=795797 RepID=D8J7K0_HALJB|nr:carbonic anhydrase [Halalkalicoccus jeotgali]ADJ16020.1 carbonic anhydrase [Halalkalicoccus jeotgali B3]ELY38116.1 carbonic anhydrase [Halalkalicoccus jeotgali B3]